MRAFLSHSSKDKFFVEGVADLLKPGTFELDATTFDAGLVNSTAIVEALKRSSVFCLFLSASSVKSPYVDFETLLGLEFLARGRISQFLAVCLDDEAFVAASDNVKFFNIVRRGVTIEGTARLIQGALLSDAAEENVLSHPFIGREEALVELEKQVIDPERPAIRAFFASGNHGMGRRALIRKFYQDHYPNVGKIFPTIDINEFAGLDELHRAVLFKLRPTLSGQAIRTHIGSFNVADESEKRRQIAALLNSLLAGREAAFLIDRGGVLTDAGGFQPEISSVIDLLDSRPHPPVSIISPRSIPFKLRRKVKDVAHIGLTSLTNSEAERLVSTLFKQNEISARPEHIQDAVALGDNHPYNYYRLVEEILVNGLAVVLANPAGFIDWKHRQSSEYISRTLFSDVERSVLGILRLVPTLDFEALVDALNLDAESASDAVLRLASLHVIEYTGSLFSISPPLRTAIERDGRFTLGNAIRQKSLGYLCDRLAIRLDEGSAEMGLVDTAVIATIQSGSSTDLMSAFLLPSHFVWLAKQNYDQGRYLDSIRLAKEGLKGAARLSYAGFVAACRYICLPASRVGDTQNFDDAIMRLDGAARDNWGHSNVAFLRGFNERMQGNIPAAENFFRDSYRLSGGNHSSARELASICLTRGNLGEAETFAREARIPAQSNVFIIDILVAILIKKLGRKAVRDPEVRELFDLLERLSQESGRSFFDTRKAELEHYYGDNQIAKRLIEQAIKKTPGIFEPRRIYTDILLKEGDKFRAAEVVKWMRDKVNSRDVGERRTNYRPYLETEARYLTEMGQFEDAKAVYQDRAAFSEEEAKLGIKGIEIVQSYKNHSR